MLLSIKSSSLKKTLLEQNTCKSCTDPKSQSSVFTCWMAGSPTIREKLSAPKSWSTVCLPLVCSLPHTDWSVLSHCSSSQLIPAAGFRERSAQDWTWCHQSPVMSLNNQEPWPLNRKEEGKRAQILTDLQTAWRWKWDIEIEMIDV